MISSGAVAGSVRSSLPNPASRGIGVKVSLSWAPAGRASIVAMAGTSHQRFFTLKLLEAHRPGLCLLVTTLDVWTQSRIASKISGGKAGSARDAGRFTPNADPAGLKLTIYRWGSMV